MTTPSGQISAQDIKNEFGEVNGTVPLGSYRVAETRGALTLAIGDGVPTSGTISYDNMRNKRLNIVVDYYGDNANLNRAANGDATMNAKTRYNTQNERVRVIGGLKSKPGNTSPHRVRIHVNQSIGGKSGEQTICALRTGAWDNGTSVIVDVGGSGKIYGGGGKGGQGGDVDTSGHAGENGASALGIDYNGTTVNVASGGLIRCGFGGGGGGGAGRQNDKGSERTVGGGGGGGGQGYPGGAGGSEGNADHGQGPGTAGDISEAGEGGGGGNNGNQAYSGAGGEGGSQGEAANNGQGGNHGAGAAGAEGSAIRRDPNVNFSLNNSGSIVGNTNQTGVS
tara:strand:- start:24 stop:1034 length:1011 start_codon:yes stop_codon:yes gene_type:complete